jgi:hypothetical protein
MKTADAPGRHLTPDEIVDRVFPADEQPAPVPLHLAACPDCQEKVSTLREAWLLDRGAVGGLVESIPDAFWIAQTSSILATATSPAGAETPRVLPFGFRPLPFSVATSFLRRPALAFGSLAAAVALVAVVTYNRLHTKPLPPIADNVVHAAPTPASPADETDKKDDELLRSIDDLLADEGPLASLVPQGVS